MAGDEITITAKGNLTADPELRFTPNGTPVANFTVACTPRSFDRQTNEWKDGVTTFLKCAVWRDGAENAAESLVKGTRVVVEGKLVTKHFETKNGEKRSAIEMEVIEVGAALSKATAKITKTTKGFQGGGNSNQGNGDSWGNGQSQGNQGNGNGGSWGGNQGNEGGGGNAADDDPWA